MDESDDDSVVSAPSTADSHGALDVLGSICNKAKHVALALNAWSARVTDTDKKLRNALSKLGPTILPSLVASSLINTALEAQGTTWARAVRDAVPIGSGRVGFTPTVCMPHAGGCLCASECGDGDGSRHHNLIEAIQCTGSDESVPITASQLEQLEQIYILHETMWVDLDPLVGSESLHRPEFEALRKTSRKAWVSLRLATSELVCGIGRREGMQVACATAKRARVERF